MNTLLAYIAAHQTIILILWPSVSGLASLLYLTLEENTKAHAALSFLASLGIDIPKIASTLATLFNLNGSGGSGGSGSNSGGGNVTPLNPPTPPANMRSQLPWMFAFVAAAVIALIIGSAITGCADPALAPLEPQIEKVVLADVLAGDTLPHIEADVSAIIAATGKPAADVVLMVNSALALLIDTGVIPQADLDYAHMLFAASHAKVAAKLHVLP